ncbi:HAD family hydrolase [Candidatus Palauibacter sp.]|uniref:HAD family hydrolase n=1 Tax=Candidatus Palauibacter sp. TaxID=3101350 RepID=UPI003B517F72
MSNHGPLCTILFDLDGTLVDSADLILESWRHTMDAHFEEPPPEDVWLRTLGQPLRAQFGYLVDTAEEVQAMVETYLEHNFREHERLIRSFPRVSETLVELRTRGVRIGVVTSKASAGTARSLAACALDESLFDVIVTSDEPVPHKPDPAPVRLALERLDASPETAAYVGDSVWDMRAGHAAGVTTVAALWGPFSERELAIERPHIMLDAFEDLLSYLALPEAPPPA